MKATTISFIKMKLWKPTTMIIATTQTMKTKNSSSLIPAAVLTAALALTALGQDTKPSTPAPLSAERTVLVTVTATVKAIDQEKREVTLKGPLGNVVTFVV